MRITSILRAGTLAFALTAALTSVAPAFAGRVDNDAASSQQAQNSNTGTYDGADFEAAKHAFN